MRNVMILALALASPLAASQALACNVIQVAPVLPASLPSPEMQPAPVASASCVTAADFAARMRQIAAAASRPAAPAATPTAGAYVPKTKDDNSPWRFDMNQNGRRMTAEEFDAWMKAKGIRVATGKPGADAAPAATTCQPSATVTC